MMKNMIRWMIYFLGMMLLALGITLNAKTGLGASAIVSVPYTFSKGLDLDYANLTLITYCLLVLLQFIIKGKEKQWIDLLQIVVSLVFTRFMALFSNIFDYQCGNMIMDIVVLIIAIILTGIGAALTVDMKLIPNPGDGIVSCISDKSKKELGLCKNAVDITCVCMSLVIGLFFGNIFLGVGLGTFISMIGVGRVISVFNSFMKERMLKVSGL